MDSEYRPVPDAAFDRGSFLELLGDGIERVRDGVGLRCTSPGSLAGTGPQRISHTEAVDTGLVGAEHAVLPL